MTKMADIPIYGKNPLKIGIIHLGCGAYQVCSNDDPRLTLTYLTSRSNLLPNAFKLEQFCKVYF